MTIHMDDLRRATVVLPGMSPVRAASLRGPSALPHQIEVPRPRFVEPAPSRTPRTALHLLGPWAPERPRLTSAAATDALRRLDAGEQFGFRPDTLHVEPQRRVARSPRSLP